MGRGSPSFRQRTDPTAVRAARVYMYLVPLLLRGAKVGTRGLITESGGSWARGVKSRKLFYSFAYLVTETI